jgi:hypothetical protein
MSKIMIPARSAEDWKAFLAEPDKQWKTGYSARTLAHCWQGATVFPEEVENVLRQATPFQEIEMLVAIPEHQVALPGGITPSQNDLWVLARCPDGLVSMAVEGKVAETFGPTIKEWDHASSAGKQERLRFLCSTLNLPFPPPEDVRYQLLHRTASAILEANRYFAKYAVMLVHSFSQSDQRLDATIVSRPCSECPATRMSLRRWDLRALFRCFWVGCGGRKNTWIASARKLEASNE